MYSHLLWQIYIFIQRILSICLYIYIPISYIHTKCLTNNHTVYKLLLYLCMRACIYKKIRFKYMCVCVLPNYGWTLLSSYIRIASNIVDEFLCHVHANVCLLYIFFFLYYTHIFFMDKNACLSIFFYAMTRVQNICTYIFIHTFFLIDSFSRPFIIVFRKEKKKHFLLKYNMP